MEDLYKNKFRVKSLRLENWDYSTNWWYFVTICVKDFRKCLGKIERSKFVQNRFGEIVKEELLGLPNHYPCELDEVIIMPNHVHFIIVLDKKNNTTGTDNVVETIHELSLRKKILIKYRRRMLLPLVIGRFKMQTAKKINFLKQTPGISFWQTNYYEHIIRNEVSLEKIRLYIRNNPYKWDIDEYN